MDRIKNLYVEIHYSGVISCSRRFTRRMESPSSRCVSKSFSLGMFGTLVDCRNLLGLASTTGGVSYSLFRRPVSGGSPP